ncbi:hypothetical protein [Virgibacillus ihumii]|uniref:hypothetical protein n=1 Tax=Virgibacillus ihumii TaxID=2686091 RepID=UPI001FE87AC8|nr:hypothetical protein [Virgibacillus ihumii]
MCSRREKSPGGYQRDIVPGFLFWIAISVISGTSTLRGEHQLYGENINRTGRTSTIREKHQPYQANINHTGKTSTVRGKHQPYGKNINRS